MKIRHRIPREAYFVSEPVSAEYQSQVDATVASAEVRFAAAERRLQSAERKLAKASGAGDGTARTLRALTELVELRRQELISAQRAMQTTPAGSTHRGLGRHHRPVPRMETI